MFFLTGGTRESLRGLNITHRLDVMVSGSHCEYRVVSFTCVCVEGEAQVCFVGLFCGVGRAHRVLVKHKLTGKWALLASGEPFGECRAMKRSTAPKKGEEKRKIKL